MYGVGRRLCAAPRWDVWIMLLRRCPPPLGPDFVRVRRLLSVDRCSAREHVCGDPCQSPTCALLVCGRAAPGPPPPPRPTFPASTGQVEKITTQKKENLILNVDGVIACAFVDMLRTCGAFSKEEADESIANGCLNGMFVLGRSVGFIGHYLDQKRLKQVCVRTCGGRHLLAPLPCCRCYQAAALWSFVRVYVPGAGPLSPPLGRHLVRRRGPDVERRRELPPSDSAMFPFPIHRSHSPLYLVRCSFQSPQLTAAAVPLDEFTSDNALPGYGKPSHLWAGWVEGRQCCPLPSARTGRSYTSTREDSGKITGPPVLRLSTTAQQHSAAQHSSTAQHFISLQPGNDSLWQSRQY
jgi:hypothetical protein